MIVLPSDSRFRIWLKAHPSDASLGKFNLSENDLSPSMVRLACALSDSKGEAVAISVEAVGNEKGTPCRWSAPYQSSQLCGTGEALLYLPRR